MPTVVRVGLRIYKFMMSQCRMPSVVVMTVQTSPELRETKKSEAVADWLLEPRQTIAPDWSTMVTDILFTPDVVSTDKQPLAQSTIGTFDTASIVTRLIMGVFEFWVSAFTKVVRVPNAKISVVKMSFIVDVFLISKFWRKVTTESSNNPYFRHRKKFAFFAMFLRCFCDENAMC